MGSNSRCITIVLEFLHYEFMQRALLGGILIGITCAVIGVFLVLNRLSLLGDGLAHLSFGGIAVGMLFGVNPLYAALGIAVLGALFVQRLIQKARIYGDAATAVILSFGVGLAVVIIGAVKGFSVNLFSFLIGSILALSITDIVLIATIFVLVVGTVIVLYKRLVFITFSSAVAQTNGINVTLVNYVFAVLTAVTVIIAIRAVGILLVSSLLVIPALISLRFSRSFKSTLVIASATSVVAVLLGTFIAFYADIPPGGTIVLVLCALFLGTLAVKRTGTAQA
ncbi:MAG: metal ABC transporter permease [Candidatus Woesearchaeota archaeon]|nr:metal ABC transporter permease [Candidatus Woesearchaeota archaeon]